MGNGIAYAVLAIWPLIAIRLYKTKTIQEATLLTLLGGFMLLPVKTEIDLPLIPPLGKHSIPVVSALIGCWFVKRKRIAFFANKGLLKWLVIMFFVGPFITTELNGDSIIVGGKFLKGLDYHDALSSIIRQFLFIAPFFIGRRFFRSYEHQLLMFKTLVIAGLIYSLPMLFEIRMSPQLHTWVYGYFPHSFGQQMRFGGFRPVVFMGHGLLVSFFTAIVLISASALWKSQIKVTRFSLSSVTYYLLMVLLLCKSVASFAYGLIGFFWVKNMKPKTQCKIAVVLMSIAMLYPTLSITKLFPHQVLINQALSLDSARAQSLKFRFDNEKILLEHARERFYFGWGGWSRNRVFNVDTGRDESTTDGRWIITFGQFGFLGFITEFGLFAIVVFRANVVSKLINSKKELTLFAAHTLLISFIMIDQLPNASLAPWLWLLIGILLGRSEAIISQNKVKPILI